MKKFGLKKRMQWGWFQSALLGIGIGLVLAPMVDATLDFKFERISLGPKVKVILNGDVVALAKSKEAGEEAYKKARLAYNAEGIRSVDLNVVYEDVDKEADKETIRGMKVLQDDALVEQIYASIPSYDKKSKDLAYTMRIDDYTVTAASMEGLIYALEQTQSKYDEQDNFQVEIVKPSQENVTMYEVCVTKKNTTDKEEEANSEEAQENTEEKISDSSEEKQDTKKSEEKSDEDTKDVINQGENDGVKYVGFADDIQVMRTYVNCAEIQDDESVYQELTEQKSEPGIYVVKPGDYLAGIAQKNNMTEEELKELNPDVQSDENLYYDDRLHVMVPTTPVEVLVQKQETYEEKYNEDVVYEDDEDMFIGETEVVQEGKEGTHIVTDLVTYKNDIEDTREQLEENVEVAAVAQIVKRGTKSKPTYMYPVTNWNVTSNFGYRWGRLHAGTDVGVPIGTTVRASRGGQVSVAGWVGGYGNCVMIDHGDGITTVYGHLSEITTSVGSYVDQGQQIALSGNTGRSTGPHLHFEIRVNGSATDATPYLEGTAQ